MSADLSEGLRDAVMESAEITQLLAQWAGEPAIHTRVPAPADSEYPMIVIPPAASNEEMDALSANRTIQVRDVIVYGRVPDQYRIVEQIGFALRAVFHRRKFLTVPDGFAVVDIRASGPMPAPVDVDMTAGRMVRLTIRLREI